MKLKIAMIGGGSYSWTYGLFSTFLANPFYDRETELCLYDINEKALDDTFRFCSYYNDMYPDKAITLKKTLSEDEALAGADFVTVAISHGGLQAELEDHYIARRHGFYNVKGSESGIAGASRTVRHVPEFVRIAKKMKRLCPAAMMLNVTNPLTALTRCVQKYADVHAVGFCHGIRNHLEILLPYFGADSFEHVSFSVSGVDHCSFLTDIKFYGEDALEIMRSKRMIEAAWAGKTNITFDDPFAGRENERIRFILWDMLGCMPGLSDEHCAEFYYQTTGTQQNRDLFGMHYDRIKDRVAAVNQLRDAIVKPLESGVMPPLRISQEHPDRVIEADANGSMSVDVADVITEVNYITKQNPHPFIFEAADVNSDNDVNIIDVVATVDLILHPQAGSQAAQENTAFYYIENGILYVESDAVLGGVQCTFEAEQGHTFTALSALNEFEKVGTWQSEDQYLFMAYSMSGKTIGVGKTALLQIGDAEMTDIVLSDAQGHNVHAIPQASTALDGTLFMPCSTKYIQDHSLYIKIGNHIYNAMGIMIK